jgi:hypothetical protein
MNDKGFASLVPEISPKETWAMENRSMANYCVVVTSGAYARFFTLKTLAAPVSEFGPKLIEQGDLFNPEKEIPGHELYAQPKSGHSRAPLEVLIMAMTTTARNTRMNVIATLPARF